MRCNNEALLKKIGIKTLDQNTEIDFRIRRDLPDCRKINTKNFTAVSAGYGYNKYRKPINRFECGRKGCVNTGLLMMDEAGETVTYRAMYDATDFVAGVLTFYVYPDAAVTYPVAVSVAISDKDSFADADVYTVQVTEDMVTDDGFAPVMINLATAPSSEEGSGWSASESGAYIRLSADKKVGYSSIAIYDSIDDFDLMETVTISCLTTVGGTFNLEVVEAQCQETRYNDQVNVLEYPVTGTKITPNFMSLFPMIRKGDSTEGFDMVTVSKTIGADGHIKLADAAQEVCGFITVQVSDSCDVGEATYTQSSANSITGVDEGHYIVVKNNDGTTDLVFNTAQAGIDVLVRYPRRAEVEELVANVDNLNSTQVSMTVPHKLDDGTKLLYVFDNVYITGFPATITNEAAEFAFTLNIGRDDEGNFFRIYKIRN